jgi:phosphate transport system substrate-binding protein
MPLSLSIRAAARSLVPQREPACRNGRPRIAAAALAIVSIGFAGSCLAQGKALVGGAGSMVPVIQELTRAYEAQSGSQAFEIMTNSLGSGGGIKGVEAGRLAIGLTGRPLKDSEKNAGVYRQLAVMPVTVAVPASLPLPGLTAAQLCGIYSGAITSWKQVGGPDMPIVPLTRNEDDSDKEALREHVGCYKTLKESSDVVVLSSGGAMRTAVAARPNAIGLTTYDAVLKSEGKLRALAIDGVAPGSETVRTGKYKLVKDFAVVTKGEPAGPVKGLLDFTASTEGQRILVNAGLVPRR